MQPTLHLSIYALCVLLFAAQLQGTQHGPISSAQSLSEALQTVEAGDTIIIADGRHNDWSVDLDAKGTPKAIVTIRPETPGGVTFTGQNQFIFSGSYIRMEDFRFDGCDLVQNLIEFDRSDHCYVTNCVFQHCGGERAAICIQAGARNNRISECRFINIAARSVNLTINEKIDEEGIPSGNVIRNNHFQDIPPAGENGRETIKIGTNQPTYGHIMVGTIVEDNTFLRCNGEAEIISNKCSGNIYRRNVFTQCDGELVMRGGSKCLIEGNRFFDGSGGIRICGTEHTVKDNLILNSSGTGIRLFFGMTKEQGGHYQAAGQCLIVNNTIVNAVRAGILIGDSRGKDWKEKGLQNIPPEGNRILSNVITGNIGDLLLADHAPNNIIENNLFHRQGDAIISIPGDNPIYSDPLSSDPATAHYSPSQRSSVQ